ncbi:MAG: hypothetical protein N4A65_10380 [Cohaesibacter sp.]|nr:hypothetical protein [Cohaesibacter sp.]
MLQTNILFVDATNNGRSIMAEAYFNQHSRGHLRAFSAGITPAPVLDRHILEVFKENNITPDDYCPKPIDIFLQPYSPRIDLIIGFQPSIDQFTLPLFPNQPKITHLQIKPVVERMENVSRKQAVRDCFADMRLVIDRALASGQLPRHEAA